MIEQPCQACRIRKKNKDMKWFQVLDDTSTTIHKLYEIQFWPNLFLINREGKVLQRQGLRGEEMMKTLATVLE
jgi:hypothetical protein